MNDLNKSYHELAKEENTRLELAQQLADLVDPKRQVAQYDKEGSYTITNDDGFSARVLHKSDGQSFVDPRFKNLNRMMSNPQEAVDMVRHALLYPDEYPVSELEQMVEHIRSNRDEAEKLKAALIPEARVP